MGLIKGLKKQVENLTSISQAGYSIFPVWAEEGSGLSNNNSQWSFGNGAIGNIGISMPECEVYAMSMQAETSGTSVSIELMQNNVSALNQLFNGASEFIELATPIAFGLGDILGFRTGVETGAYADVRVTAWCRIPLVGLKGEKGDTGQIQVMRIGLTGQSNVNGANIPLLLESPSLNTITGSTVALNIVSLPVGIYKVTLDVSLNATVNRTNIGFRFIKDGALYSLKNGSNYIRNTGGHNETGDSVSDIIRYLSPGTLAFESFSQAASGTVNLEGGGNSRILIQKIG